jgi:soluble lytic murein transglycosylase
MINKTRVISILVSLWILGGTLVISTPVRADIYRYVDSDGIVHFTNVPTVPGYSLYMREGSAPRVRARTSPSLYEGYISEAARKHGVSTSLIKAVIKAESNFDPVAVSRSGACGLMQIMPETAKTLGIADPFDPKENIFGGTRYLKELLTQFRGSLPLALAAYNAGPGKVESGNGIPRIPETRSFVRRVMRYLKYY